MPPCLKIQSRSSSKLAKLELCYGAHDELRLPEGMAEAASAIHGQTNSTHKLYSHITSLACSLAAAEMNATPTLFLGLFFGPLFFRNVGGAIKCFGDAFLKVLEFASWKVPCFKIWSPIMMVKICSFLLKQQTVWLDH